ncbi:MAG: insulinase family protein [Candidatus Woesebacteria bacterium]
MKKKVPGFSILHTQEIPELHTKATLYVHDHTRAQILSLENADENKSFGITFRTPPPDSSGIAHILEHSVLCGSKKYPLKEPFIELVKGSLNTFLNAFTYPDKTSYPVASTNEKDFYNLVGVYLDAVFFPNLSKETLMQEGWHLHQEKPADPVEYKGIVFNEMEGAYNSPDRALWDTTQASLLPDTSYVHDSGGDPLEIPNLRYEDFLAFHKKYYHPSNSFIFFSGNDPEEKRLKLIEEYLSQFEFQDIDSVIPVQTTFKSPITVHAPVSISNDDDPKKKGMMTVNWVLEKSTEIEIGMRLRILSTILTGTAAAPLRKALIDSGIGEDIAGGGVESDLQQMIFSIGLKGMDSAKAKKVERLILKTLQDLVKNGIDQKAIDSAMNTVEFRAREQNTGSFPRGLSLLYGALTSWLYGGDPIIALAFEKPLAQLKAELKKGDKVFERLITTYLLENTHRSTVIMDPDTKWNSKREAQEKKNIKLRIKSLSKEEQENIRTQTKKLMELQIKADSKEALATLPRLALTDLEQKNVSIPIDILKDGNSSIVTHDLPTNGIIYFDMGFDLSAIPENLLSYVPLFTRCLLEMGTATESFEDFLHRQSRGTGGVWTALFTASAIDGKETISKLFVRSKWLPHQKSEAVNILLDALLHANFDNQERFMQMVLEEKTNFETSVLEDGHHYAASRIQAQLHESDWLDEQFGGVEQLFFIRKLAKSVKKDWKSIHGKLDELREIIVSNQNVIFNITSEPEVKTKMITTARELLQSLPTKRHQPEKWLFVPAHQDEILTVPTTVNYVAKGADLYAHGYTFAGSSLVISRYLRTSWLWEQVRMKGGAYGAFSSFDFLTGLFTFASYRDPHLQETLNVFDHTTSFLREATLSDEELSKAIIGQISDFDHYMLPDAKGFASLTRYLIGMTDEKRQRIRQQILRTSVRDFSDFANTLEIVKTKGVVAIVTNTKHAKEIASSLPTAKTISVA